MRNVNATAEQADILDAVLRIGLEAVRKQLHEGQGLSVPPLRAAYEVVRDAVREVQDALTDKAGAVIQVPRRPEAK